MGLAERERPRVPLVGVDLAGGHLSSSGYTDRVGKTIHDGSSCSLWLNKPVRKQAVKLRASHRPRTTVSRVLRVGEATRAANASVSFCCFDHTTIPPPRVFQTLRNTEAFVCRPGIGPG